MFWGDAKEREGEIERQLRQNGSSSHNSQGPSFFYFLSLRKCIWRNPSQISPSFSRTWTWKKNTITTWVLSFLLLLGKGVWKWTLWFKTNLRKREKEETIKTSSEVLILKWSEVKFHVMFCYFILFHVTRHSHWNSTLFCFINEKKKPAAPNTTPYSNSPIFFILCLFPLLSGLLLYKLVRK